ncbi:MAG: glycosyltransferase [Nitrosomonadales bacterium]|nr:glycosyltransferase [Nitrosomonadales bacterium]
MKILLATPSLMPEVGGPAYSVSAIHRYLNDNDCKVATLTRRGQGGEYAGLADMGKFIAEFDIVHNFGTWSPFNHGISTAAWRADVPQIFCPMGMLEPWALEQKKLKKKAGWLLYQRRDIERSAVIHATSGSEAGNIRALGVRTPIAIIPHGVDIPAALPARADDMQGDTVRTALFLSRLHPKKGLLELVEAWSLLRPAGWRVVIAGPDTDGYGAVVADAIVRHRLRGCISMIGPVFDEAKASLFASSDLFVLPTHSENFGLVIPEALGHGVPVITTTGAPWGELQETGSGWWIAPGVQALAQALDEAVGTPIAELRAMGKRGRLLVEERYGWQAIIQKHLELYRWVARGQTRPEFILE